MTMKKKMLVAAVATLFAVPSLYAAYNAPNPADANTGTTDNANDLQNVTITVPEVALLDISDADVALTGGDLAEPTDAGSGFTGAATAATAPTFAVSSNVSATASTRSINVAVTTGAIPTGGTLTVTGTGIGTDGSADLDSSTTTSGVDQTTGIVTAIGNVASSAGEITYSFAPTTANGMIAFTGADGTQADTVELTYTLSDDG